MVTEVVTITAGQVYEYSLPGQTYVGRIVILHMNHDCTIHVCTLNEDGVKVDSDSVGIESFIRAVEMGWMRLTVDRVEGSVR